MPWTHCDQELPDDEHCPTCHISKESWTIEWNNTRTFQVGRKASRRQSLRLVLEDASGKPVSDEPFEVVLPDGSRHEGSLDEYGTAKVSSKSAGGCTVHFPRRSAGGVFRSSGPGEAAAHPDEAAFSCETHSKNPHRFKLGAQDTRSETVALLETGTGRTVLATPALLAGLREAHAELRAVRDDLVKELAGAKGDAPPKALARLREATGADEGPIDPSAVAGDALLREFVLLTPEPTLLYAGAATVTRLEEKAGARLEEATPKALDPGPRALAERWGDPKRLSGAYESRFLRWTAPKLTLAKDDTHLSANAIGKIDLLQAKTSVSWLVPGEGGLELPVHGHKEPIRVRARLKGETGGFVGALAELHGDAAALLGKGADGFELRAGAGFEAFVGAKVFVELAVELDWAPKTSEAWREVGSVEVAAEASAGAGVEGKFKIGWDGETQCFFLLVKFNVTVKVGVGAWWRVELQPLQAVEFVGALLLHVDYHYLREVEREAFLRLGHLGVGMALEGVEEVTEGVLHLASSIKHWWGGHLWEHEQIVTLAKNITSGRAQAFLEHSPPEVKGRALHTLCGKIVHKGKAQSAAVKILESARTARELGQILKSVDPGAVEDRSLRTVRHGYDVLSTFVSEPLFHWGETEHQRLDACLTRHGLSVPPE